MGKIAHAWFGDLDSDRFDDSDIVWERSFSLRDVDFDVWLWAGPDTEFDAGILDAFAARLNHLDAMDAEARESLRAYLTTNRDYIDFHVEELDGNDAIARAIGNSDGQSVTAEAFVAEMRLRKLGLWLTDASSQPIVADYMIDPDASDQVLAVKMSAEGRVISVDWES